MRLSYKFFCIGYFYSKDKIGKLLSDKL